MNYQREFISKGVYYVNPRTTDLYVQSVERYSNVPLDLPDVARDAYRAFVKRERKVYVGESRIRGRGLFAGEDIPAGAVFLEYSGERVAAEDVDKRQKEYEGLGVCGDYFYTFPDGNVAMDATCEGGLARFANNSCEPNATIDYRDLPGCDYKIVVLVALKRIRKHDEITFRYNFSYKPGDILVWCSCGAPRCSGVIN